MGGAFGLCIHLALVVCCLCHREAISLALCSRYCASDQRLAVRGHPLVPAYYLIVGGVLGLLVKTGRGNLCRGRI